MKATINVIRNQEGEFKWYAWTLVVNFRDGITKYFYLGQDTKFCYRVLCCEPSYVVNQIGSNDMGKESVRKKLANFIIKELDLDAKKLRTLEGGALACQ